MGYDLSRFVEAQSPVYPSVVRELRDGRKRSHWMWFVFPQLAGLGRSPTAEHYAIDGLDHARQYLAHPVLGARLRECAGIVASLSAGPDDVFGTVDALKLCSSMTLFLRAAPGETVFADVLERHYGGEADPATDRLLES